MKRSDYPADSVGASALVRFLAVSGTSVAGLAVQLGIGERTMYRIARGEQRPNLRDALAIRAWTGGSVRPEYWLTSAELADVLEAGS